MTISPLAMPGSEALPPQRNRSFASPSGPYHPDRFLFGPRRACTPPPSRVPEPRGWGRGKGRERTWAHLSPLSCPSPTLSLTGRVRVGGRGRQRQRQRDVWNTHGQQRHHGQDHDTWMQPCLLRSGNPPARLLHLPRHRQEGLLPRASGRRSTPRLAGQRRGPRVAGGEVGRRRGTPFDPRSATRKRRTQVLWETPIAVPSERSMRPLRGHRCVGGVEGRDLTSSRGNRVGKVTVVLDHPNCFARAKGRRSMAPSEAGDPWERVGSRSEISKGGNDQQAVCRADLVDLPIRFSLDAESPQWRKGPAHKPQLVRWTIPARRRIERTRCAGTRLTVHASNTVQCLWDQVPSNRRSDPPPAHGESSASFHAPTCDGNPEGSALLSGVSRHRRPPPGDAIALLHPWRRRVR